ncbi:MAG TPA: sulfurtransferase [Terriglobales bacterium]|nr:sulfurtransferase [Terriglobales bacterium]
MRSVVMLLCCACLFAGAAAAGEPAASSSPGILVTPSWLAAHLEDPHLVVLHVASLRADYDAGHVPGARFLWPTRLAENTPEQTSVMPPVEAMVRALRDLGVNNDSRIVICQTLGDVASAARMYLTLDRLGIGDRTSILDGGFEAWKAEGRPVSTARAAARRGRFVAHLKDDVVVDLNTVAAEYRNPGVRLVDGRPASYFNAPNHSFVRGGHIPGAKSLPSSALFDSTDRYVSLDSLKRCFAAAGVQSGDRLIAYCQIGRSACPVYVAAKMLGYEVRFYDGSFEEWSRHRELPVEGKTTN